MRKVIVYFNLHQKRWSIKSAETNKVIGYAETVVLRDVKPKVSEAGRQRVLKEKQKNVHAGLEGLLVWQSDRVYKVNLEEITYNPYKHSSFVYKNNDSIYFTGCKEAILTNKHVYVC